MAAVSRKRTSRAKKGTTAKKPMKASKTTQEPRRPAPVEAPDRGEHVWEREAPEVHEAQRSEAPDAGLGAPEEPEDAY